MALGHVGWLAILHWKCGDTSMQIIIEVPNGTLEVRTAQRTDRRWDCEYRLVTEHSASAWESASMSEGFVSCDTALSAGLLLGQQYARNHAPG